MDQQPPPDPQPVEPAPPDPPPVQPAPPAPPPSASSAAAPQAAAAPPPAATLPAATPPQAGQTAGPAAAPAGWQPDPVPLGPAPGVEFAGYGARLVAYIIDGLILGVVISVLTLVIVAILAAGFVDDGDVNSAGSVLFTVILTVVILVLSLLYFPYFWQKSGRTPGMSAFGIRVVRDADGGPLGWGSAILRYLGFFIDSIVFGLPIGFLWVFYDKRRRAWHDLIGGTVVIKG
jgi:uncharacterized RDD family membrane protein YckC